MSLKVFINHHLVPEIQVAMEKWSIRGCAIVVTQGREEEIVMFGYRDRTNLVTSETLFALASCSKLVTVLAILRALSKQNLSINTTVKSIIPEFKLYDSFAECQCTIEDILCHRTGVPGYDHLWNPSYSIHTLIERLGQLKPTAGLRERHQYNSLMYDLVCLIVERLVQKPFEEYVKEEFFIPLDMKSTTFAHLDEDKEYAQGNWNRMTLEVEEKSRTMTFGLDRMGERGGIGTGRLWMNGEDTLKWLKALPLMPEYSEAILPRIAVGLAGGLEYSDHAVLYGLGQRISTHRGVLIAEHSGEIPGFLSRLSRLPEHDVGFAVLTNSDSGGKYLRAFVKCRLIEHFAELDKLDWLEKIEIVRQEQMLSTRSWLTSVDDITHEHVSEDDPLVGTWMSEGFDTWHILSSSLMAHLPDMSSLPFIPALYGQPNYVFSPSRVKGKYQACFQWKSYDTKEIMYGYPFSVQVLDGERIEVIGLMGVGEGMNEEDFGIVFHRMM
ncbi:uncharacterized protein IL334_005732 [Kwoniella shivajii]|uniref:Beta-lactamase-related domain-containing protein n=1 Tax=Kwoniella shivajii TaxID=564305 RepID=A0ABZ1D3Y5_9TREE|nr:hypothetical protein IL334_005732 [Kwoniella shivajii]